MIENGRPRYWIDWYDRWFLLLPVALLCVLVILWQLPATPSPAKALGLGSAGTARSRANPPAHPVRQPLAPPILESPQNGKGFFPNKIADAEGHSEPGVIIYLDYTASDLVWHELSQMATDGIGRFHFQLHNFPPGSYRLRVRAVAIDGRSAVSGEAMITITPETVREPRRRRTKK